MLSEEQLREEPTKVESTHKKEEVQGIDVKKVSKCPVHIFMAYIERENEALKQYMMYGALFIAAHVPLLYKGATANQLKTTGGCPATPMMMYGLTLFVMAAFAMFF